MLKNILLNLKKLIYLLPDLCMDITGPVNEVGHRGLDVFMFVLGSNAHHGHPFNVLQQGTHSLTLQEYGRTPSDNRFPNSWFD